MRAIQGGKGMRDKVSKLARAALVAVALAPLGACALADVASGPAPSLYVLTAPSPDLTAVASEGRPLLVEEFSAPAAIDTSRIVFMPSPNEIRYYAGARWADRAPGMIAALLVETLADTGRFPAVVGPGAQARSDLILVGDVRSFAAHRPDGAGLSDATSVRVALFVRLIAARGREVVASREFSADAAAASGGMSDVVGAYDAALGSVLADIARWTLEESGKAGLDLGRGAES